MFFIVYYFLYDFYNNNKSTFTARLFANLNETKKETFLYYCNLGDALTYPVIDYYYLRASHAMMQCTKCRFLIAVRQTRCRWESVWTSSHSRSRSGFSLHWAT